MTRGGGQRCSRGSRSAPCNAFPSIGAPCGGSPSWGELPLPRRKLGSVLPALPGGTWATGGRVWWVARTCSCSREIFWREPSPRKKGFSPALPLAVNTLSSLALVAARGSRGELCGVLLGLSPPAGASVCSGNGVAHPTGDGAAAPILCYQECWCLCIPEHGVFNYF